MKESEQGKEPWRRLICNLFVSLCFKSYHHQLPVILWSYSWLWPRIFSTANSQHELLISYYFSSLISLLKNTSAKVHDLQDELNYACLSRGSTKLDSAGYRPSRTRAVHACLRRQGHCKLIKQLFGHFYPIVKRLKSDKSCKFQDDKPPSTEYNGSINGLISKNNINYMLWFSESAGWKPAGDFGHVRELSPSPSKQLNLLKEQSLQCSSFEGHGGDSCRVFLEFVTDLHMRE